MKYGIVIATVPFVYRIPQTGPALLKASLKKAGISCKVVDWNLDIYKRFNSNVVINQNLGYFDEEMEKFCLKNLENITLEWISEVKKFNPKWLGLSIYSSRSNPVIKTICRLFKQEMPDIKIVVGGHGVSGSFQMFLLKIKLIDCFINGEGEEAIVSLLKNEKETLDFNETPTKQIEYLDSIPFPDYSDIDPPLYPEKKFFIITSRGCIRKCNFCSNYFKKIKFRSPENIILEISDLIQKYNITHFFFADSLSNGNPKQLKGIANTIIKYEKNRIIPKITWGCCMCCLPKNVMKEKLYKIIKESGCVNINIGIESGSYKVREDMNKRTKDEDIYFMMEQCAKNKIRVSINFIVGYYTENEEEFQKSLDLVTNLSCIKDIMLTINVGSTFMLDNIKNWEHLGLKKDKFTEWYYKNNTYPVRVDRWLRLVDHCKKMKIPFLIRQRREILIRLQKYEKNNKIIDMINILQTEIGDQFK